MKKNLTNTKPLLAAACLLVSSQAFADPYLYAPGTKALGMGTAFTAIADDASSVWYNPAGVVGPQSVVFEVGYDKAELTSSGETAWENETFFIAKAGNGSGVYFYNPYHFEQSVNETDRGTAITGQLESTIYLLGFAVGDYLISPDDSGKELGFFTDMSYGWGMELGYIATGSSNLSAGATELSVDDTLGGSLSAGLLTTLYKTNERDWYMPSVKMGLVYRSEMFILEDSLTEEIVNGETYLASDYLITKPESYEVGLAFVSTMFSSKNMGVFTYELAAQMGNTDYKDLELEFEKIAYGLNLTWARQSELFKQFSIRVGQYTSEEKEFSFEVTGNTIGLSVVASDEWIFELAYEDREWGDTDSFDDTIILGSVRWLY
jgi:hypothetical protein